MERMKKMIGKIKKKAVAWLMVLAMIVGVVGIVAPVKVQAAGNGSGVTFGVAKWQNARSEYSFPDVQVAMPEGVDKQRVFCISVDNGGSFTINKESFTNAVDISGIVNGAGTYVDNSGVAGITAITNSQQLISVTILGDLKDNDIKNFIKNMTFYRNTIDVTVKQKVSVVSSVFDARDVGATALTIDGDIHYYKYVDWNDQSSKKYVGKDTVTSLPASPVKDDSTKWTWYYAYNLAKQDKIDVSADGTKYLKGYLATITSTMEQNFIYNKLGVESAGTAQGAWVGGARTHTLEENAGASGLNYDQDSITALYPWISGQYAMDWKWMCGPESHDSASRTFYTIASASNDYHGGTVKTYANWNDAPGDQEPNNFNVVGTKDAYHQEYTLHYGYKNDGKWNDWYPNCNEIVETGMAVPAGYLIEFSPYDINDDGDVEDPGEKGGSDVHEDLTIITAEPHLISAALSSSSIVSGKNIDVVSVKGDLIPGEELIGGAVPVYQWEVLNPDTNKWENAKGAGSNTISYTPTVDDRWKKVRCHITPSGAGGYIGDLYVDAAGSDDYSKKVSGSPVLGPTVEGNNFMISVAEASKATDASVKKYSKASATVDGTTATGVSNISATELDTINKAKKGDSVDVTLVNGSDTTVKKTVKATVYDNVSEPTVTGGVTSQIGSNNFYVPGKSGDKDTGFVVTNGKVTVLKDGDVATDTDYEIAKTDLDRLNKAIADDIQTTVDIPVKDKTTGLTTTVKITIIPSEEYVSGGTGKDIVYEKTNPQDKPEPIDPNKTVPTTGGLKVNGQPVDNYTINSDGTKIIINKDYLNTLPNGDYPAEIIYTDGSSQKFTISVIDYDKRTIVKNPPLFSMYKEIVLKKKNTFTINLKGISDYAVVSSKITGKGKKAKKIVSIKQQKNGEVLITPKKTGKTQVTCTIIQNGAEYKVVVDIKVLNQYKGTSKNYNLKNKGLVKTSGELPEFNVYKRIVKGKNTKIKFTKVAKDAKVKFYVANKKEAKSLKIGKVKRKGKTVTCTVMGKKKGWVHLTAEITQNGKTYYTRLLVRIDDGTWSKKQLKKYLK
jgi:hypothetical protein